MVSRSSRGPSTLERASASGRVENDREIIYGIGVNTPGINTVSALNVTCLRGADSGAATCGVGAAPAIIRGGPYLRWRWALPLRRLTTEQINRA